MVLLDSRLPKDSNGILFAIFGLPEHFLRILQDLDKNRYLKSIRTQPGHVACFDWVVPVRVDLH
jgi:hypothetical protein